jgi:hypothetical protein
VRGELSAISDQPLATGGMLHFAFRILHFAFNEQCKVQNEKYKMKNEFLNTQRSPGTSSGQGPSWVSECPLEQIAALGLRCRTSIGGEGNHFWHCGQ